MELIFQDKKLRKCAEDERRCKKELGERRGALFLKRIYDLYSADSLEDLRYYPGHYHELAGDRKGQWACDLDQPYRLIFTPHADPIPSDSEGKYIWVEIREVEIIEITNYHGK
ncbi:MAG: type II toxin-antitoxin system RelE/ParE family toxin [Bacteroidaceae bacterium]|nr:type II toxin-antitoxin system RelE/ParE family toxin [Bacteroidaceae bacterium]